MILLNSFSCNMIELTVSLELCLLFNEINHIRVYINNKCNKIRLKLVNVLVRHIVQFDLNINFLKNLQNFDDDII